MGTRYQGVSMNEKTTQLKHLIDGCHKAHWDALLLHCSTGLPHKFFPEIDFTCAADVAFIEGYLTLKLNPKATEVVR